MTRKSDFGKRSGEGADASELQVIHGNFEQLAVA
jgi:hypothetical protein